MCNLLLSRPHFLTNNENNMILFWMKFRSELLYSKFPCFLEQIIVTEVLLVVVFLAGIL